MTSVFRPFAALLLAALGTGVTGAEAADPTDPTWPCVQRKVERLSAGVMWPRPLAEGGETSAAEEDLGATLALRRVSLEEAEELVAGFATENSGTDADGWARIFVSAFDRINKDRTELVRGIERYALSQHGLSDEIDALRAEMDTALAAAEPDYDRIDAMETDLDWKQRIFEDRSRSLLYVCESPVLLEKRAFALARMLSSQIQE